MAYDGNETRTSYETAPWNGTELPPLDDPSDNATALDFNQFYFYEVSSDNGRGLSKKDYLGRVPSRILKAPPIIQFSRREKRKTRAFQKIKCFSKWEIIKNGNEIVMEEEMKNL